MPYALTIKGRAFLFCLLTLVSFAAISSPSPQITAHSAQEVRIARLTGLGKAWGVIKFFHPRLARVGIDWDRALVDAIPKVDAALSPQDYAAVLNVMIAVLADPTTHVRLRGNDPAIVAPTMPAETKEPVRLEAGVLVIDVRAAVRNGYQDAKLAAFAEKAGQLIAHAKAVVLDLRADTSFDEATGFARETFMSDLYPEILDRQLTLATQRYRIHNGYTPQSGVSSGSFYSGVITRTPSVLTGRNKAKTPPITILVNAYSSSMNAVVGLQAAGMAYVLQEGGPPATGDTATIDLADDVVLTMSTTELVAPDGAVGFVADKVVALGQVPSIELLTLAWQERKHPPQIIAAMTQAPSDGKDYAYPDMAFPSTNYRLLALFRYWNVINYFFPYKDIIGGEWDDVLPRYIPRFEANRNALEYETTLRELSVETHDRHAFMGPTMAFFQKVGAFIPPVALRYVEGQSMVAAVLDRKAPVRVGDVILGIDGQSMASRRDYFAGLYPASTPQGTMDAVNPFLLRGQKDSIAQLTVRGVDGAIRDVRIRRSMDYYAPVFVNAFNRKTRVVAILPGGVGYVDLARLQSNEVDLMFATIKDTKATIFDMRGYPNGTAWAIAPRLSKRRNPVAALLSQPMREGVAIGDDGPGTPTYQFKDRLPDAHGTHYGGGVVMLIDEQTASQAEHTCLMFEAATDVTFIGTPTAGVNGDATNLLLPGGITASFSGDAVRHADGRQLQRIGIQPTIRVAPTIAGLAAGRDEVLEAAVELLNPKPR